MQSNIQHTPENESSAVIIESLLEQAQDSLLQSNQNLHLSKKKEMLDSAKRMAENVLELDNRNPDAHHILALSHTLLGESSRAKRHIVKAFELGEPSDILKLEKAHIDLAAGHYNKAEAGFLEILQDQPNNADAFLGMAITKQKKKDWGSAFLHYNSLINKDIVTDTIISGLSTVAPHLEVDLWSVEYETTVLTALDTNTIDKQGFAPLCNSLLTHKYNLAQPDTQLDFGELIRDQLLFQVISHKLIASPETELLVTLLRETLLVQISQSKELPELLQTWVIAIAEAASYYGYCWPVNDQEAQILRDIASAIKAENRSTTNIEECAAAVLLHGMYEELYASPFSYQLLAKSLADWPQGMQPLLASSLYEPAHLHGIEVELKQSLTPSYSAHSAHSAHSTLLYERDLLSPFPKWTTLNTAEEQSATRYLKETFGERIPLKTRKRPLNVLVSASDTGQHALQMAAQFNDINLVGADTGLANLAYAEYQARNLEIENVRWVKCEETMLTCLNQQFDIVDWRTPLNQSENSAETLAYIKRLMAATGIAKIRVNLNESQATENLLKKLATDNHLQADLPTLRSIRRAIIEDSGKQDWQSVLSNPAFYFTGSCMKMVFGKQHHFITAQQTDENLNKCKLELIGVADHDSGKVSRSANLAAWEASFPLSLEKPKSLVLFVKKACN